MEISILSNWGEKMGAKKYFFYVSDPKLKETLDELKRQRLFPEVMQALLKNGLEKQIIRKLKEFRKLDEKYKK